MTARRFHRPAWPGNALGPQGVAGFMRTVSPTPGSDNRAPAGSRAMAGKPEQ